MRLLLLEGRVVLCLLRLGEEGRRARGAACGRGCVRITSGMTGQQLQTPQLHAEEVRETGRLHAAHVMPLSFRDHGVAVCATVTRSADREGCGAMAGEVGRGSKRRGSPGSRDSHRSTDSPVA